MKVSVLVSVYGSDPAWEKMAYDRAIPSAMGQGAHEVLFSHRTDATIAQIRNENAARATGDYLCHLDADDELAPDYLGAMARAFEQEGGDSITTALLLTPAVQRLSHTGYTRGKPAFFDRGIPLTDDNWLIVGTLIQRDLFMRIGGFSDYEHGFEDWSCWYKAQKAGARIVKVPDAIYRYWINPRSKHKIGWRDHKWQHARHMEIAAELAAWTP